MVQLKADHASRPLWVVSLHAHSVPCVNAHLIQDSSGSTVLTASSTSVQPALLLQAGDGHIFLESFSPIYKHARDFLIAISEVRPWWALLCVSGHAALLLTHVRCTPSSLATPLTSSLSVDQNSSMNSN